MLERTAAHRCRRSAQRRVGDRPRGTEPASLARSLVPRERRSHATTCRKSGPRRPGPAFPRAAPGGRRHRSEARSGAALPRRAVQGRRQARGQGGARHRRRLGHRTRRRVPVRARGRRRRDQLPARGRGGRPGHARRSRVGGSRLPDAAGRSHRRGDVPRARAQYRGALRAARRPRVQRRAPATQEDASRRHRRGVRPHVQDERLRHFLARTRGAGGHAGRRRHPRHQLADGRPRIGRAPGLLGDQGCDQRAGEGDGGQPDGAAHPRECDRPRSGVDAAQSLRRGTSGGG